MKETVVSKKIFLISVTDNEESLNRMYTESIYELFKASSQFREYIIEPHYKRPDENLYNSLTESVKNEYEGYIVVADCIDGTVLFNPNVMFEFGGIYYLGKPFVLLSSVPAELLPFDIKNVNLEMIPAAFVDYIKESWLKKEQPKVNYHFFTECQDPEIRSKINSFLNSTFSKYNFSLKSIEMGDLIENTASITDELKKIESLLLNTAEYIDGESAAFIALQEAVSNARVSLRTTRFANESIVAMGATEAQNKFMQSLYETSRDISDKFDRIICNNHPAKWNDVFNILFYGGNGSKVYVRKRTFSIHFELVIIDEKVAFIHFYQTDNSGRKNSYDGIEKLNSTLKLQGSTICKKLANIFDRLHHRDFTEKMPKEPSRTLLGIPLGEEEWDSSYTNYGCFSVDRNVKKYEPYGYNVERKKYILNMFRRAFRTWQFDDSEDKINMLVGIALLENNCSCINEAQADRKIKDQEFKKAKDLYDKYRIC